MKYYNLHKALILSLCATFAACSEQEVIVEQPVVVEEKTPIELTVGGVDSQGAVSRTIITNNPYNPQDFTNKAYIFMVIKSEKEVDEHGNVVPHDGYEFKGDRNKVLYTVCRGDVDANTNVVKFDSWNQKYWDDAHARSSQISIWAYAQQDLPKVGWLNCTFQKPKEGEAPLDHETPEHLLAEYEDAPFYTYQVPNDWIDEVTGHCKGAIYPCIMKWSASHHVDDKHQDANSLKYQDLLFTNNIANYNTDGNHPDDDKRLKFNFGTKHFPQSGSAQMNFYHAMSKITINIIEGEGYDHSSDADFKFTYTNTLYKNVKLTDFNTTGTFNIKNGYFERIIAHDTIPSIAQTTLKGVSPNPYYQLQAIVIPNIEGTNELNDVYSRFTPEGANTMMEFAIDYNTFKISSKQLYNALHVGGVPTGALVTGATKKTNNGTYIPLEAGKNYIFTFVINKTKVSGITAKVADWEDVTAVEQAPSNARITIDVDDRGTAKIKDVAFYRALNESSSLDDNYTSYNWNKQYEKATNAQYQAPVWKTEWFWPNNKSFYHFRAISPASTDTYSDVAPNGDYFTIQTVPATDADVEDTFTPAYNEIAWGATFTKNQTTGEPPTNNAFTYSVTKGFDGTGAESEPITHQLYKAIGPTDNVINMVMFHVMSAVNFTIITSDDASKVELCHNNGGEPDPYDRTKVQLIGYYPDGKVYLGDAHIVPSGTQSTLANRKDIDFSWADDNTPYVAQEYYFSAVPQNLENVKLYITTPDNNEYIVELDKATVNTITSNNIENPYTQTGNKITRWYPGFKYHYTFRLTQKGIDKLQVTILNWETVEATYDDVQIQ